MKKETITAKFELTGDAAKLAQWLNSQFLYNTLCKELPFFPRHELAVTVLVGAGARPDLDKTGGPDIGEMLPGVLIDLSPAPIIKLICEKIEARYNKMHEDAGPGDTQEETARQTARIESQRVKDEEIVSTFVNLCAFYKVLDEHGKELPAKS